MRKMQNEARFFRSFPGKSIWRRKPVAPDPDTNPALRLVMDKAKAANMPNDNVDRAIKKATSATEGENYDEVSYEASRGVAILVHALTDNNRTAKCEWHLPATVATLEKPARLVTCLTAGAIGIM